MPLTSFIPKISEDGNEVDISTATFGDVEGASTSSSAYMMSTQHNVSMSFGSAYILSEYIRTSKH